ncbi:N-6 DNA methylase [Candidatus Parcubacteria bacterium]|nr:N-6 DNA methylase [Candidatus Parcubacteria bacterium]
MSELNKLFKKLGVSTSDYLLTLGGDKWKRFIPYRLQKGLEEINPNAFFIQENKPIVLFFDFTKNKINNEKDLFKKIWNLGGVPVVFIIKDDITEIYNGFSFDTKTSTLELFQSNKKDILDDEISIWDIFLGKLWKKLPVAKSQVDESLLRNIQDAQKELTDKGLEDVYANNIIGRLLFSRYLIDREVMIDKKYFSDKWSFLQILESKNKKLLYEYFDYLKTTFNGDLFPVKKDELGKVNNSHLDVLYRLFKGDTMATGQQSLFEAYDFKIIPVELISEVYERFIGLEKQRKEGAYYTPSFLVDYILNKTVKKHLVKNKSCRVLDPSCGSGIFLVETLRWIIEKSDQDNISYSKLGKIVKDNIFGVDKDENAINLSIFSLCLTLLDYITPKDITKFRFPSLKGENLFVADFFDTEHEFNKKIKNLDFILGNPPWGSDKGKSNYHINYFNNQGVPVSDKQIAQSFVVRVKDFSTKTTKCALVLTSKVLYNHNAKDFRKYWFNNFFINEVLELSPVRSQLFAQATAPSSIVFYEFAHGKDTSDRIIIHTSIKPNIFLKYLKILVIEKNDIKKIKQKYFKKYDWLWKVMLYGNVFDFYFIKKLKENSKTVNSFIEKSEIVFGAGFKRANKKNKLAHLSNKYLLEPSSLRAYKKPNKDIKLINKYPDLLFENGGVEEVYKKPHLILKRTLKDRPIITYSENEFIFPNTIFGIHGKDKLLLKSIGAYFSSDLTRYLLFLMSSAWGVEREEVLQKEYKELPFLSDKDIKNKLSGLFDELLEVAKNKYNRTMLDNTNYDKLIEKKIHEINLFLYKKLKLSEQEKRLIDYNINVSIPSFFGEDHPILSCTLDQLKRYAKIFVDHFSTRWSEKPNFFEVDIFYNDYIVGMNFKVVKEKGSNIVNVIKSSGQNDSLIKLMKISENKITDKIYQQRDVRGFNKASFYIVKSNQFKNWHPAVAQADLHEFIDSMMQSELELLET